MHTVFLIAGKYCDSFDEGDLLSCEMHSHCSSYRKLAIHLTNTKDAAIPVACIPPKAGSTQSAWTPAVTPISEWTTQVTKGDVNADGAFNITDAVLLQKWLLTVPDMHPADWKATDFNNDNYLDASDLSMMKRVLMKL